MSTSSFDDIAVHQTPAVSAARGTTPTFSISIEWENSRFAELDRTRRMLRRLRQELVELAPPPHPPQITLLYDRFTIDGDLVRRVVDEELQPDDLPAMTEIVATDRLRYYQQKNFGARRTHGDIVVFLDCDVIPEPGWLAALLGSFDAPEVAAAGGETYVELTGIVSRAFALFWFFNLREEDTTLVPAEFFHANNVAFRRSVFAAHGFPDVPLYRGQCTMLSATLLAEGLGLYRQQAARVSHPYPRSLSYFMARALHNGRDHVVGKKLSGGGKNPSLRAVYWQYLDNVARVRRRIREHSKDVGLGFAGAMAAQSIAFSYMTLRAIGEAVTLARPNLIPRLFPI